MALLKIARMGHPVLRSAARPVEDPRSAEITRLVHDMIETMMDAGGVGLAAPQVHVPVRLVVFWVPPERADNPEAPEGAVDGAVPLTVLINPVITPLGSEQGTDWEGCLSLPGLAGQVPRFQRIRYGGQDTDGRWFERMAEGFHARVVQHECDHLDGILYPMRMADLTTFGFAEEVRRTLPTADGGAAGPLAEELEAS
jgi:peptide deformylase